MKKIWVVLLTIGLSLSGCNTITDNPDEFTNISEENVENINEFKMLDGWTKLDPNGTEQHFINNDRSSMIIIEESYRLDPGDLNLNEYLEATSQLYNLGGVMKATGAEIVEMGDEQFGLLRLETDVDTKRLRQLQVTTLLDIKDITVGGQNVDNSDPENLKDTLLEVALLIKKSL